VPRLAADLNSLSRLMASDCPPERIIRASTVMVALYGFGDASGAGFGSTILGPTGIHYRYGLWGSDLDGASSNDHKLFKLSETAEAHIRELPFTHLWTLVDSVASEATASTLTGCEFYLFTDNAVAEAAFFKGTSSNPRLFDLIVCLKQLKLDHSFTLHLIHVAGRHMISQGIDGLSRGDLLSGVMQGHNMLSFVPLHLLAQDRSSRVHPWVQSWVPPGSVVQPLALIDWFGAGHGLLDWRLNRDGLPSLVSTPTDSGIVHLWLPPPAAAGIAIEQLSFSRLKRPFLFHVFIVPRLMTYLWRKHITNNYFKCV